MKDQCNGNGLQNLAFNATVRVERTFKYEIEFLFSCLMTTNITVTVLIYLNIINQYNQYQKN